MNRVAQISLPAAHPMFAGHFPGRPIVPGAYLVALVQQHAETWLAQQGIGARVCGVASVKFVRALGPEQTFTIELGDPAEHKLRFRVSAAGDGVSVCASGTLLLSGSADTHTKAAAA